MTDWGPINEAIEIRSGGRCEIRSPACVGRWDVRHHALMRSKGGQDCAEHILASCNPCHVYLHAHPAEAYEKGWLIRMSANL